MSGVVHLVGAGPGDPRLITVLGLDLLRQADVVVYDRLVSPDPRSRGQARGRADLRGQGGRGTLLPPGGDQRPPRPTRPGRQAGRPPQGGRSLRVRPRREEALACAEAGVPWEVVPGVTSALGVPARAGIPVTHREISGGFSVVTGHCLEGDRQNWENLARVDTLVILMGLSRLPEIAAHLLWNGRPAETPAAVIEQGPSPESGGDRHARDHRQGRRPGRPALPSHGGGGRGGAASRSALHDLAEPDLEHRADVLGLFG